MIKAVIFDLDGVIVSTDDCHYRAWKKMADEEGIYFDREINNRLRGVSRMASLEIVLEKANRKWQRGRITIIKTLVHSTIGDSSILDIMGRVRTYSWAVLC